MNFNDVGRIATAIDYKVLPSGKGVANFNIAIDRLYTDKDSKKITDFHPVECWEAVALSVANNLSKGRLIQVQGTIVNNNYIDKDTNRTQYGYKIQAEYIKFLDYPKDKKQDNE